MITRREAVAAGVLAGVGTAVSGGVSAAAPADAAVAQDPLSSRDAVELLRGIRDELRQVRADAASCRMPMCAGLAAIRRNQRQFLKANQKFPDFMEVGPGVWDEVVDWYVRTQRPLAVARTDGRYTLPFLETTLILRVDFDDELVGLGFDTRTGG